MRVIIERELRPGVVKTTVVSVRDTGGGMLAVLGSVPGKPEVPGALAFTRKVKGNSYALAAHALAAVMTEIDRRAEPPEGEP